MPEQTTYPLPELTNRPTPIVELRLKLTAEQVSLLGESLKRQSEAWMAFKRFDIADATLELNDTVDRAYVEALNLGRLQMLDFDYPEAEWVMTRGRDGSTIVQSRLGR